MDMLQTGEIDKVNTAFAQWFEASDDPGKEVINFLLSEGNSTEEKNVLQYLLGSHTAMGTIKNLDLSVVKQLGLAAPEHAELWESVLHTVSVTSTEARAELLSSLPIITNEKIISASLMAIKPDFLAPAERSQLLSEISTYAESDNEDVRSAAVLSLGQWSAQDYAYVVEDMLANGTEQEKIAALMTAGNGKLWSVQIQHESLLALSDESASTEIRMNAFMALSNRALDDESYAHVHRFYEQHILPLKPEP